MQVRVYGKHPSHEEFVRLAASSGASAPFEQWLHDNVVDLHVHESDLSEPVIRFMLELSGRRLVGALTASRDKVGRAFPLAVSCELDAAMQSIPCSCLPLLLQDWLEAAHSVLEEVRCGAIAPLATFVETEPSFHLADTPRALSRVREGRGESALQFARRLLGDQPNVEHYLLRTLALAGAWAEGSGQGQVPALWCPLREREDLGVWLEAVRPLLSGTRRFTSCVWADRAALVFLGPASGQALRSIDARYATAEGVWPVWTDSREALRESGLGLPRSILSSLEQGCSLSEIFAAQEVQS